MISPGFAALRRYDAIRVLACDDGINEVQRLNQWRLCVMKSDMHGEQCGVGELRRSKVGRSVQSCDRERERNAAPALFVCNEI